MPDWVTPRRGHSYISRTTPDAARLRSTHVAFSLIGRRATRHLREKDLNSPEEIGDSLEFVPHPLKPESQQRQGPPAGLPELFSARGFNGLRGRARPHHSRSHAGDDLDWRIRPCAPSLGVLMHSQRLDLTDNERAVLITALRRLVDFNPQPLSPQIHALKAILERLEPQKPQPIPDTAGTG